MKRISNTFFIAKEGIRNVIIVVVLALLILFLSTSFVLKLFVVLLLIGMILLYRNPERIPTAADPEDALFAPCDGTVKEIESFNCDGKIQGECFKITIQKHLYSASMLRAPLKAHYEVVELKRGMRLTMSPKAIKINEQAKILFYNKEKERKVVLKLFLKPFSHALKLFFTKDAIEQTERFAFLVRGEVHLFVPANCRIAVKRHSKIVAGETVLAYFNN